MTWSPIGRGLRVAQHSAGRVRVGATRLALLLTFVLVVTVLLTLAPAASARPATTPLPPVLPPVVYGQCPYDESAFACFDDGTVYIQQPDRFTLEHEYGHAFDHQVMTDAAHWQFEVILGLHEDWWWPDYGTPDAHELFADAYAECRLQHRPDRGAWDYGTYGYQPTMRQHQRICALIRNTHRG